MFKTKYTLRQKLYIYLFVAVLLLFMFMGIVTYFMVFNLIKNQNKANGVAIAQAAAGDIDGDIFQKIDSQDCDEYHQVYEVLAKYRDIESIRYIYTMIMDDALRFVVDADPDNPAEFREEYDSFDDILPAFEGKACSDKDFSQDKWGIMLSSYAPIFNSQGEVVGVVGIDARIEYLKTYRNALLRILAIIILIFGSVAVVVYMRISEDLLKRDGLTELYKQKSLEEIAGRRFTGSNSLSNYSVVMLNIRNFRLINDKYGYALGDKILIYVAENIKQLMKNRGMASRTSGDNYISLVRNAVLDSFIDGIKVLKYSFIHDGIEEEISIPICCGVYEIRDGDTISDAINRGFVALKNARKLDNSGVVYFTSEMYETAIYERTILADFDEAIANNEFVVYYQPKVDIRENRLCGAEALVRWMKDGRMIPPGLFVPIYEREGKITDLDFFVCEKVCAKISEWKEKGMEIVPISVNFSKVHLIQEGFADRIISIVDRYGVDHNCLDIELTESSGYSDRDALDNFIKKIRAAGIRTSMDDFGSGYASLELLDRSLFDTVKVDKSITDKICINLSGKNFLKNIVKTISDINCEAVCEGVETIEQVEFLKNKTSCNIVQGYFFDRPLPCDEFEGRLLNPGY